MQQDGAFRWCEECAWEDPENPEVVPRECGAEKLMENVFVGDRSPERAAWDSGGRRWNGAS